MNFETDNSTLEQQSASSSFLKFLRGLSFVEGTSTLVLFGIAMPLKYMAGMPMAVKIVGSLHGFLFVGLVFMLMAAVTKIPISSRVAFVGMLAAIVPFGPFVYDHWLMKHVAKNAS